MATERKKKDKKVMPILRRTSKPRYWSSAYWNDNSIKDVLSEIIKPDDIDMSTIKVNDHLNPAIWEDEDTIRPVVRRALLKVATEFIRYCKIEDKKFGDILLVGSNANYNYTPQSDVDLHIVTDFSKVDADAELIGEFFKTKKEMWSLEHNITIDEHAIECYIQDVNEPNVSSGVYSIMRNQWIKKPIRKFLSVDEAAVQMKVADIINKIDIINDAFVQGVDVSQKVAHVKERIKNMRKAGLYKEGEFSPENLAFKILRNSGYLDKLTKMKNTSFDQDTSINQSNKETANGNT